MKRRTMAFGGLLMAVAITGYSVAGTYAKYISSYGMADSARVAKWDFTDTAVNTVDLFRNSYTTDDGKTYVASSDNSKVIAPGTSGTYSYHIEGTAETNYKVSQTLTIDNKVQLKNGDVVYYDPIEFCVGACDNDANWFRLTDADADTKLAIAPSNKVYAANEQADLSGSISWRWAFGNEAGNTYTVDSFDTLLGEEIVKDSSLYTITATIGATVEQTQEPADKDVLYGSISNNLSKAEKADLAGLGYDSSKASLSWNGRALKGTLAEQDSNKVLYNWFGGDAWTSSNYFYAMNIKVPTGYKLYTITNKGALKAYDGNEKLMIFNIVPKATDATKAEDIQYAIVKADQTIADKAAFDALTEGKYVIDCSGIELK